MLSRAQDMIGKVQTVEPLKKFSSLGMEGLSVTGKGPAILCIGLLDSHL